MVSKALYRTHVEGKLKGEIIRVSWFYDVLKQEETCGTFEHGVNHPSLQKITKDIVHTLYALDALDRNN